MAKRSEWTFSFPAADVAAACREMVKHHHDREQTWTTQQDAAERELRDKGLSLREMPVTGGTRLDAVFDPQLKGRLEECREKVAQHKRQREEYEAYFRALSLAAKNDSVVHLDVSDVQYFGI